MQAIILAAGQSSRFYPLNSRHKSLISILGEAVISHTLRSVKKAGITDVIVVVNDRDEFEKVLGNGKRYGVKVQYVVQEMPSGMGDAVIAAEKLIKDDFFVAHASRVEFDALKSDIDDRRGTNNFGVILCEESNSLSSYGVVRVEGDRVIEIIEKHEEGKAPSNLRVKGFYFLNREFITILKKVKKHQYSFEEALDVFAKEGKLKFVVTKKKTSTLKYPWDLLTLKDYLLESRTKSLSKKASISKNAIIEGAVIVEEGAIIAEKAVIKGPAYIGRNSYVGSNSLLRNGVLLEENSVIGANAEVKNTIFFPNSKMHSGVVEDSIIGSNTRIGAGIITANTRIDRGEISTVVKGKKVSTGVKNLGVIVGDNTMIGAKVVSMPGVIIGNNVTIGPSTTVMKNIDSDTTYYAKFVENIEKKKAL